MVAAATDVLPFRSAKDYLNITVDKHDDELMEFLVAAVAGVEEFHDVVLIDRDVVETVDARNSQGLLTNLPIRELTSVSADDGSGRSWPVSRLQVTDAGVLYAGTGAPLHGRVRVAYRAGMTPVPPSYPSAVKLVLARSWQTQRPGAPGARGGNISGSGGNNTGPTAMRRVVEDVLGATIPGIA